MAKSERPSRRTTVKTIEGIHPDHGTYFHFTIYSDGIVRIERPWSCLIYRKEMELLEENAFNHRHLIWRIQEGNGEAYWKPDSTELETITE